MDTSGAIRVQRSVLQELDPEHNVSRKVIFVESFGARMRRIIDTFPEKTGRDPTPADIIWCLGCDTCQDPRVLMCRCPVPSESSQNNAQ